ncbi:MAG: Type IV secretory pathway VirB4 component-like protein [Candidatus Nomurabacteria bacterium GW2011_GWB1_37_5]|uniref:Type IV secretory pathway VirB4 component-like protein n=1 Tax=Candidatus Nomurabacteria bacterium GW2011_GWB1_37_5 TaxID=1618742 RepID=A0A0G0GXE4_9BACT|nr:MAG: Type IV secretory pathway VirB4 component-like protein [Candidatus Nomurabacteria bacterium GW2011_GWB1_37_5]
MGIFDIFKKKSAQGEAEKDLLALLPEDIYKSATLELQDIIAPSALQIDSKKLVLGDRVAKTFFVISYPRFLTDNWFTPVINLDKIFDVSIFIHPIETSKILKQFQKKVAEVQSQINIREGKGLVRDPILDTAFRDLEGLRDRLQQATEKIFDVGLYITIYGSDENELFKTENEIKSILESRLIYVRPALFQQDEAFQSVVPIGNDDLKIYHKLNSEPLSSLFPFVSFDLTSDKGILYGINRHNSSLVIFDRFSMENYNSVIFAKSGAGKSFTTKLEILRTLMFDTEVIVIDPEREYEYLAEAVGGRYFNISLSSNHHINPFDLPIPREDEAPADVLRSHIINLVGLFRIMLGGLTPEEDALIDRAISETYALKDISVNSNFANVEPPLLSDFESVLAGMEGADSILVKLSKYTRGTWSTFINQPSNVDINKKMVVFSVRDMEDELKPVAMYIVTHFIWNAVRRNLKKRLLVVDEAWWMMKSEDTASFLFSIAKRGRKYYLGLCTITQDVADFMGTTYGVAIVANSSIQLLLKQSPSSIEKLQKTFNLTDEEKYLLLESGVGEGIFFAGLKHVAIKIIASYTEEQIISTDPAQILAIQKAKQELAANESAPMRAEAIPLPQSTPAPIEATPGLEEVKIRETPGVGASLTPGVEENFGLEEPIEPKITETMIEEDLKEKIKVKEELDTNRKIQSTKKALEDKGITPTEEDLIKNLGSEIEDLEEQMKNL